MQSIPAKHLLAFPLVVVVIAGYGIFFNNCNTQQVTGEWKQSHGLQFQSNLTWS